MMHATPPSCRSVGSSESRITPRSDRADGLDRQRDRRQRGRQPRQRDRDQQPAEHLRGERERQQPRVRGPARHEVGVADREPGGDGHHGGDRGRVEQRPGRAAQVAAALAQHEDEAGVGHAGQEAEQHAARRVLAVGAGLERAGDQHDAGAHQRERDEDPPLDPLAQHRPRGERDDHHLEVAEHRREPGADVLDRVVPEDQVAREEHAGGGRQQAVAAGARAEAAVLPQRERAEHGHRVRAAEDRGRRGRRRRRA